jgi:hypothetical protein
MKNGFISTVKSSFSGFSKGFYRSLDNILHIPNNGIQIPNFKNFKKSMIRKWKTSKSETIGEIVGWSAPIMSAALIGNWLLKSQKQNDHNNIQIN